MIQVHGANNAIAFIKQKYQSFFSKNMEDLKKKQLRTMSNPYILLRRALISVHAFASGWAILPQAAWWV